MPLSDITILITSFLRPGYLAECLKRIAANLPECKVLVVDDSQQGDPLTNFANDARDIARKLDRGEYIEPRPATIHLPFDSGLPAKRNAGAKAIKTKFMLMGSDDFDFGTPEARAGVIKLLETMEEFSKIDVAGGHFNHQPYEGFLDYVPGSHIKESRLDPKLSTEQFYQVDITVNYWMARPELLVEIPQDERMKIGGEHGDWFLSLKEAGKTVVWVPGVNINALPYEPKWQHPDYGTYRGRARNLGHRIFLQKRGITNYYGFDEAVPTPRSVRQPITMPTRSSRPEPKYIPPDPVEPSADAKPLIMVMCNHKSHDRVAAIRNTWAQHTKAFVVGEEGGDIVRFTNLIDLRFFFGQTTDTSRMQYPDEVFLNVPDDYNSLPLKVQAAFAWALEHGYTNALKIDDDTYVVPKNLLTSGFEAHDWIGRINHQPSGHYCSGGSGYWLSNKAMEVVAKGKLNGDWAEDREIGRILRNAGINPTNDKRYTLYPFFGETLSDFCTACMIFENLPKNRFVQPVSMAEMHEAFITTGSLPTVRY